jgi:hypothetical protein
VVVKIAANATARARLLGMLGREEVQPAHLRGKPAVEAAELQRGGRKRVLGMWARPLARKRMSQQTQALWPPRWPAHGAVRAQPVACGLVLAA